MNDEADRPRNYHSLRHTFVSNLARAGVSAKVAMDLARHSDINLTLRRYTHTLLPERASAIDALPDLTGGQLEQHAQQATGTCDIGPDSLPISLPKNLPSPAASEGSRVASDCISGRNARGTSRQENPTKQGVPCTSMHPMYRRGGDSNPRYGVTRTPVFETGTFSRSVTSPNINDYNRACGHP